MLAPSCRTGAGQNQVAIGGDVDVAGQKMAAKYKAKIQTPHGLRTCLQAVIERSGREPLVARFGGIPLKRQQKAVLTDRIPERIIYPGKSCLSGSSGANARSASKRAAW